MFITLYIREIQNYLYEFRFQASFVIMLLVFGIGSVSFTATFDEVQLDYAQLQQSQQTFVDEMASTNISNLVTKQHFFITAPRSNGVIADCKENLLPNNIRYSAYNVFGFDIRKGNVNPLMTQTNNLNWSFIVSMFLSFITLLFAFDAISGEKEKHTLALVFSNPVSCKIFLISKLASIVTVVTLMAVVGIIVSILILVLSGKIPVDSTFLIETAGFLVISILLITAFAVFGLMASAITQHSNISLLISLCFWLFAAVIIPNTSVFWANKLFPIPTSDEVNRVTNEEISDIYRNAPDGSESSMDGNPFYPRHELRAKLYMNLMLCQKKHADNYYSQMFNQFEKIRTFTLLSPIAQFDYMNEAFLGGGYLRFRTNWDNLHIFQEQYLQWFKDIDAKDPKSPHWYNPYEIFSTSMQAVSPDQVPLYTEHIAPFGNRIRFISGYLIAMVAMIAVLFVVSFVLFVRYDVR